MANTKNGSYAVNANVSGGSTPASFSLTNIYAQPLTIQDRPRGRIWIERMERIRWVLAAEFVGDNVVYATAEQTGLFIRLSTRRPVAIPEALRARFAP